MKELDNERHKEETAVKTAEAEAERIKHQANGAIMRRNHAVAEEQRSTHLQRNDPVKEMIDNICCEERLPKKSSRKKRKLPERPENWLIIAEHYSQWGMRNTIRNFPAEFAERTSRSADQALRIWLADLKANKLQSAVNSRAAAYGNPIDLLLIKNVKIRVEAGLPIDDVTLRMLLVDILESHGKLALLIENGGKFTFGHGWAHRFWKRHNMASRVVTTKMRILPANFDALEENYITVAIHMVHRHKIPPDLVYGQDETNAQFVSRPNKTRAAKGAKRVRLLGVGHEKPQITVTFALKETGDVVGLHQMIFGGKTKRCEPQKSSRLDTYYDHTESHWQTPPTYITFLMRVVVADKDATIARLGLPANQAALVIHDLHYSHKDATVLAFMKENNLLSLYIPAACTDVMQTCDTVANKPFKVGLKAAFRNFLHFEYESWKRDFPDVDSRGQWDPKFTVGTLKEMITGFVAVGMDALKTPAMKLCISEAFARDSRLAVIRSPEREAMVALCSLSDEGPDLTEGEEPEVPGEVIRVDEDRAFSAFNDPDDSASDFSDVEEMGL